MEKQVYINPKQQEFLQGRQRIKAFIGGRGTGKSSLIGIRTRLAMSEMPRAKIFFSSTTYAQILTKTLPAIEIMWRQMGLREYRGKTEKGHYVVGRKPPEEFQIPYSMPRKYSNVITFFNGFTIEFLSLDRPDLVRGGSYDGGDIDEAALVNQEHFNRVILPSVRGNGHRFGKSSLHHQVCIYTSMPWKSSGAWVLDYQRKAKKYPHIYMYLEATALDNIDVLGDDYIDILQKEMSPLEFAVEVMNNRVNRVGDPFYHDFSDERHTYLPAYNYGSGKRGITVEGIVRDYNPEQVIELSMDFSGWFNGMLCIQPVGSEDRIFDSFFAVEDQKINDLIDSFTDKYKDHKFKYVRVWGEPRGHDRMPNSDTLYEQIRSRFQQLGWGCEIKARAGRTSAHAARHYFMNEMLREDNVRMPRLRINADTCKDVIIAIQMTAVKPDFSKDKSKEKDRRYPQQHAPHFTDMLDYYFYEKYKERSRIHTGILPMGAKFG